MGKPGTSTGGPGQVMETRRTRREPGFSAAHTHGSGGHSREEADLRASGSVAPRFNYCGKPNCRRHGDPPTTARAVLPMDGEGKRQDGEPQAKRTRGRALRGVDRQRPTAASAHRRAASGGRRGDESNPRDRGQGFIESSGGCGRSSRSSTGTARRLSPCHPPYPRLDAPQFAASFDTGRCRWSRLPPL